MNTFKTLLKCAYLPSLVTTSASRNTIRGVYTCDLGVPRRSGPICELALSPREPAHWELKHSRRYRARVA